MVIGLVIDGSQLFDCPTPLKHISIKNEQTGRQKKGCVVEIFAYEIFVTPHSNH